MTAMGFLNSLPQPFGILSLSNSSNAAADASPQGRKRLVEVDVPRSDDDDSVEKVVDMEEGDDYDDLATSEYSTESREARREADG